MFIKRANNLGVYTKLSLKDTVCNLPSPCAAEICYNCIPIHNVLSISTSLLCPSEDERI